MISHTEVLLVSGLLLSAALPAQVADHAGFKDPALFTRLPRYFLSSDQAFTELPFDSMEFMLPEGKTRKVEGRHLSYTYDLDESTGTPPSFVQIIRNYEAAAKRIGGQVMYDDGRRATIRLVKNGQETWVAVEGFNDGRRYSVDIVEQQAMKQDVVADAGALQGGLAKDGHVEVAGIFFDTGKSDVKPASEPALKQVAQLLKSNPSLRVWVVGHTDSVGSADSNVTLSNARAASVIRMLTGQMGLDPKRLAPHGAGPFAPVSTNQTEEGRARNRRVELVAQP